jgi:hypothetical protein
MTSTPTQDEDSASHNTGERQDRREALKGAVDYTKLLTTLATGAVLLSATFLDKFYAGRLIGLLIASWIVLGLSVLAGLIAVGEYISQFAESTLKVRRGMMEVANLFQWFLLVTGIGLLAAFVVANVTTGPVAQIDTGQTKVAHGVGKTTIMCPAGAVNGCSGSATFVLLTPAGQQVPLGTALFAIEHAGLVTVSSPKAVSKKVQGSLRADKLKVSVEAHGRYGKTQTIETTVAADGR